MWTPYIKNIWTFCPDDQSHEQSNYNVNKISPTDSYSSATWKTVAYGQPDLKSWEAFNPIHLTEMYGNDEVHPSEMSDGPGVYNTNSSDHFSGLQHTTEAVTHVISINGFLQNSIWSTSGNCMDSANHPYQLDVGNSKPDLESWSAFNPIHLTEMYRNNDVNPIKTSEGLDITLSNHSTDTSAFVPYHRIKQMDLVWPDSLQRTIVPRVSDDFFGSDEEEDLFYSELTHFMPIETFVEDNDIEIEESFMDGHTFNSSKSLDTLEIERTSSGLLRYMSEEYLEYSCNNVELANSNQLKSSNNEDFVIKFLVKRSGEIACQTEDFQLISISDKGDSPKETYRSFNHLSGSSNDINNINDNLSNSEQYGCGLKYLYKSLLKKITRCCSPKRKSVKKEHK